MSVPAAPPRRPKAQRESRGIVRLIVLFAATLGACWPLWLHRTYSALARVVRVTPRAAVLLVVVPVVNLAAPAYLAVDLPRAVRRVRTEGSGGPEPEVLSILLLLPVAAGIGVAVLLGLSLPLVLLLGGYLTWVFELPAAIALERSLAGSGQALAGASQRGETAFAVVVAVVLIGAGGIVVATGGDDERKPQAAAPAAEVSDIAVTPNALWITNT